MSKQYLALVAVVATLNCSAASADDAKLLEDARSVASAIPPFAWFGMLTEEIAKGRHGWRDCRMSREGTADDEGGF